MDKTEWHEWFCWYPVYSVEFGWVWLRTVNRKQIPADWPMKCHQRCKTKGAQISEAVTGCWHRIPDHVYD